MAARRLDKSGLKALEEVREERFELMRQLAELPDDMVFYTQITMEAAEDPAFEALSPREREILALISEGLGNADIGERLSISEKTVRNHVSNLFDKLGVWTRAQAIVFARDRGFMEQRHT